MELPCIIAVYFGDFSSTGVRILIPTVGIPAWEGFSPQTKSLEWVLTKLSDCFYLFLPWGNVTILQKDKGWVESYLKNCPISGC